MFEDDDDFEIDEEFLGGVFDAERSATICDDSPSTSHISLNNGFDLEPSPLKKRTYECTSPSRVAEKPTYKRRTSEESARLVALSTQKGDSYASDKIHGSDDHNFADDCFKPPLVPSPKSNLCGRGLTGNISGSDTSFTLNTSRVRQRKFPGPAGLLPERDRSNMQGQKPNFSSLSHYTESDLEETEEPLSFCSQSSASVLEDGPWAALQSDISGEGQGLLRRYTVSWVKQKAAARQLVGQKVPFLAAVLSSIDCSSPDPCVVLRDSTGEIPGTLHRSVWDSFGGQLVAGSALVLRLVGVLSTGISARRHYLNITSNNIVTIYSSPLCESTIPSTSNRVKKTDVHKWTINQLLQTANSWEDQSRKKDVPRTTHTFSTNSVAPISVPDRPFGARPLLQTSNMIANAPSSSSTPATLNRESSPFVPPAQPPWKGNLSSGALHLNSSTNGTKNSSFTRSSRTAVQGSLAHRAFSSLQSQDPSQQPSCSKSNSSSLAPQGKFVLKRPSFSGSGIHQNNSYQVTPPLAPNKSCVNENVSQSSSKDMFSDDDLDISSVLDGIDSESLFGDF